MSISIIKGSNKLKGLSEKQLMNLEMEALQQNRKNGLVFHVLKGDSDYVIKATQAIESEELLTKKEIIDITRKTFEPYLPGTRIKVQPQPFVQSPTEEVTPAWIRHQMDVSGIKLKQIAQDTGVTSSQLSLVINEKEGLSAPMRAMFFFYFKCKNLEQ